MSRVTPRFCGGCFVRTSRFCRRNPRRRVRKKLRLLLKTVQDQVRNTSAATLRDALDREESSRSMQYQALPWSACGGELREAWDTIASRNAPPASPFLTWGFFDSVAQVRDDVEAVVFRQAGEIVGCFPYQRKAKTRAIPVAGFLNDLHGPLPERLGAEEFSRLLEAAGLDRFDFHASPALPWNSPAAMLHEVAGYRAQLGTNPGDYTAHLLQTHYSVRQQKRKTQSGERKFGPIKFVWQSTDYAILDRLLEWKRQQYRRTGFVDVLAPSWTRRLLHDLLHRDRDETHGLLSALFAGDELVAAHFGMRSGPLLHCWFPAYSPAHSQMSPGMELFLRMASHAPSENVVTLDLGIGAQNFKSKLTNESYSLVCGSIDLVPWRSKFRTISRAARDQATKFAWYRGAKRAVRRALTTLHLA